VRAQTRARKPETAQFYPDLSHLIDAWPTLPPAIKAGILAMIEVVTNKGGGGCNR